MKQRPIIVTVDELVLHGFDPAEKYSIGTAVARELESRWSADPPNHSISKLDAGTIQLPNKNGKVR